MKTVRILALLNFFLQSDMFGAQASDKTTDFEFFSKKNISENTDDSTTIQLKLLGSKIFDALISENPENFKPYIHNLKDIEQSSIETDLKNKMVKSIKDNFQETEARWYGNKSRILKLIENYKVVQPQKVILEKIEPIKTKKESQAFGITIYYINIYINIDGKTGFMQAMTGQLGEHWKILRMPKIIFNINTTPEETIEMQKEVDVKLEVVDEGK